MALLAEINQLNSAEESHAGVPDARVLCTVIMHTVAHQSTTILNPDMARVDTVVAIYRTS
jgi:hypothetical protein